MIAAMSLLATVARARPARDDVGHDQRREHAEDHDDDQDLDQREAARDARRMM
jgi:hypothetical protein